MSKGKSVSKNNREGRGKSQEYFHNGKKIKPVKLVLERQSFLGAEYEDSGDVVLGSNGKPSPWHSAKTVG